MSDLPHVAAKDVQLPAPITGFNKEVLQVALQTTKVGEIFSNLHPR